MPVEGSASQNPDKTIDYSVTGVAESDDLAVSAGAFVNNYRAEPDKFNPNAPLFSVAGGSLGIAHADGHSASITAQKIPDFGKQLTAATNINVLSLDNHRVDVNAFTTHNMPKGPTPSFQTSGAGADYKYKDTFLAGASVSRTPMFQQTNYNLSTGVNLHSTPTSSLNFNVGANRTDSNFGRGTWEPKVFFGFKKTF